MRILLWVFIKETNETNKNLFKLGYTSVFFYIAFTLINISKWVHEKFYFGWPICSYILTLCNASSTTFENLFLWHHTLRALLSLMLWAYSTLANGAILEILFSKHAQHDHSDKYIFFHSPSAIYQQYSNFWLVNYEHNLHFYIIL